MLLGGEGEAREVGAVHAAIAREVAMRNRPFAKPVLILTPSTTVRRIVNMTALTVADASAAR